MIKTNCIVESTKGRDIGKLYVVIKVEGNFAYLCDGKIKNQSNLKKKNIKHIKFIENCEDLDFKSMQNCDIIYRLKSIKNNKMGGIL